MRSRVNLIEYTDPDHDKIHDHINLPEHVELPDPPAVIVPELEPKKPKRISIPLMDSNGSKAIAVSSIGLTMGLTIAICWGIGSFIDKKLGYHELFSILGTIGGAIGGFYQMIRMLISISKDDK